jgi:hypothetical protein
MFVVCSGKVSCHVEETEIKRLGVGESFGDIAIYFDHIYRVYEEHASVLGDPGALSSLYVVQFYALICLEKNVVEIHCAPKCYHSRCTASRRSTNPA